MTADLNHMRAQGVQSSNRYNGFASSHNELALRYSAVNAVLCSIFQSLEERLTDCGRGDECTAIDMLASEEVQWLGPSLAIVRALEDARFHTEDAKQLFVSTFVAAQAAHLHGLSAPGRRSADRALSAMTSVLSECQDGAGGAPRRPGDGKQELATFTLLTTLGQALAVGYLKGLAALQGVHPVVQNIAVESMKRCLRFAKCSLIAIDGAASGLALAKLDTLLTSTAELQRDEFALAICQGAVGSLRAATMKVR